MESKAKDKGLSEAEVARGERTDDYPPDKYPPMLEYRELLRRAG